MATVRGRGRRGDLEVTQPPPPAHFSLLGRRGHLRILDRVPNGVFATGRHGLLAVSQFEPPPVSAVLGLGRRGTITVAGSYSEDASFDELVGRRGRPFITDLTNVVFAHGRRGRTVISDVIPFAGAYALLLQNAGYLFIVDSDTSLYMFDQIFLRETPPSLMIGLLFQEAFNLSASIAMKSKRYQKYSESFVLEDLFAIINRIILNEHITLEDTTSFTLNKYISLADILVVEDSAITLRQAIMMIVATVWLHDKIALGSVLHFTESLVLEAVQNLQVQYLTSMVETLTLTDALTPRLSARMVVVETVHLTDSASLLRAMRMGLLEEIVFGGTLRFAGEDYTIYAMTAVGAAVSEYQGWQFNSMCVIDGVAYGADDDGISILEGDDDKGTQIQAEISTGLSTLGTSLYKRTPKVYVGFNSQGVMLMKVVSTERGNKIENWYTLDPIPLGSFEIARADVGLGLRSVYYGYKIANTSGEYFELDFVEVWRLALTRRKE